MSPRTPNPLAPKAKRKSPPYPFLIEALAALDPEVRPMFSGYAVYIGDKIVCMLRDSAKSAQDNGVWLVLSEIATPTDASLRRDLPSLRHIRLLGGKIHHWLLIPADGPNFESESMRACELLLAHDPRLGRIPKSRQAPASRKRSKNS